MGFSWQLINDSITESDKKALTDFINTPNQRFTQGRKVWEFEEEWSKYILLRGYIAINGASLTIAKKTSNSFSVFLIPETLDATNLSKVSDGDLLNLEIDQTTYATINAAESLISKN